MQAVFWNAPDKSGVYLLLHSARDQICLQ